VSEKLNEKKFPSKLSVGDRSLGVALSLAFRSMGAVSTSTLPCSAVEVEEFGCRSAGRVVFGQNS